MLPGELIAISAAVIYALSDTLIKVALQKGVSTESAILITSCFNGLMLLLFSLTSLIGGGVGFPSPGVVVLFIVGGVLGTVLGRSTFYASVRLIGPSRAVTLKTAAPVLSALLAVFFLDEQVGLETWLGILMVAGGVYLLSGGKRKDAEVVGVEVVEGGESRALSRRSVYARTMGYGVALGLVAALFYSLANVVRRYSLIIYPSALVGAAIGSLAAFLLTASLAASKGRLRSGLRVEDKVARKYLFWSALTSSLAIPTNYTAMKMIEASRAVPLLNSEPLFIILLNTFLLKGLEEPIDARVVGGALTILGGVAVIVSA